jgi:hypothetical protein
MDSDTDTSSRGVGGGEVPIHSQVIVKRRHASVASTVRPTGIRVVRRCALGCRTVCCGR